MMKSFVRNPEGTGMETLSHPGLHGDSLVFANFFGCAK